MLFSHAGIHPIIDGCNAGVYCVSIAMIADDTLCHGEPVALRQVHVNIHLPLFNNGPIQCVPQKRKPINRVNFSENCNDLSEKAYIFTKFSLSSFF